MAEHEERTRCKGITKDGSPCKRYSSEGSEYCWQHEPEVHTANGYTSEEIQDIVDTLSIEEWEHFVEVLNYLQNHLSEIAELYALHKGRLPHTQIRTQKELEENLEHLEKAADDSSQEELISHFSERAKKLVPKLGGILALFFSQVLLEVVASRVDEIIVAPIVDEFITSRYVETLAQRGNECLLDGQHSKALRFFNLAIRLDPDHVWALTRRGETYRMLKNYERALVDFNKAIALDPRDKWALAHRGATYRTLEDYERALVDFDKAIALDPNYKWALTRRGDTYRMLHDYKRALADLDEAIALDPNYKLALASRGATYRMLEDYERALVDLDKAIQMDSKYAFAIGSRGATYRGMGRYTEALNEFNKALKLEPHDTWDLYQRGMTYARMGRYADALNDYDKAVHYGTGDDLCWALAERGETLRIVKRYVEALNDLDRAIRLKTDKSDFAFAYASRGYLHSDMGFLRKAIADLNQALRLDPQYHRARRKRDELIRKYGDPFSR